MTTSYVASSVQALSSRKSKYHKDTWEKTGQVLVMDMGDKRARHRHPWMILASKWPADDGEETAEDDFFPPSSFASLLAKCFLTSEECSQATITVH